MELGLPNKKIKKFVITVMDVVLLNLSVNLQKDTNFQSLLEH